ncbi:MAG: DNA cytosine methyltransferase [Candidatus Tenebribacter davisii]|nr:DNA cytosine methyltransferase [Candidatus Tenebribacter davisii]
MTKKLKLRELSLFSGVGGGLIGTSLFLDIKTIGMVEWDAYCQKILQQRQEDGLLDKCPIFGDIQEFNKQGYAKAYKGMVDIITGGPPCQPYSSAGLRKAEDDERDMWPATKETIRIIQPRFFIFENVPNLLSFPYIYSIFGDLSKLGYNIRWSTLSAKDVGALHKRNRLWIFGERNSNPDN